MVRGALAAVRARRRYFLGIAAAVFVLEIFLPPLVLSLARKPWDFFTFNPWLSRLPEYLASEKVPISRKLEFLPNLILFWFSADSPAGGIDWGFAVDVSDLLRFVVTALLFGLYFALWLHHRDRLRGWGASGARRGGLAGVFVNVLGLSTGPCSVMGCGAPGLPVFGLAFAGLSSGMLELLASISRVATAAVLILVTAGVAYLAWLAGGPVEGGRLSPGPPRLPSLRAPSAGRSPGLTTRPSAVGSRSRVTRRVGRTF
jgi:hypothetical protein